MAGLPPCARKRLIICRHPFQAEHIKKKREVLLQVITAQLKWKVVLEALQSQGSDVEICPCIRDQSGHAVGLEATRRRDGSRALCGP